MIQKETKEELKKAILDYLIMVNQNIIVNYLSAEDLVATTEWLIEQQPDNKVRQSDEYYFKLRSLLNFPEHNEFGIITSRCINGVMDDAGFDLATFKLHWYAAKHLPAKERINYIIDSEFWRLKNR